MTSEDLPEDVVAFVSKRISSVEQINVLILLRAQPGREWTVAEISAELRSTESSIAKRLDALYATGVLRPPEPPDARIRYSPTSPPMGDALGRLLDVYRSRPDRVIELVYSRPAEAILAFAEAFRLTKEKP